MMVGLFAILISIVSFEREMTVEYFNTNASCS